MIGSTRQGARCARTDWRWRTRIVSRAPLRHSLTMAWWIAGCGTLGSACTARATPEARPSASASLIAALTPPAGPVRPHLVRMRPDSANPGLDAVVIVEVVGTGFTTEHNHVVFGSTEAADVPSTNGTSLRFPVPRNYPATGEAPPPRVGAGRFMVTIVNANGTSDSLAFTLTGSRPMIAAPRSAWCPLNRASTVPCRPGVWRGAFESSPLRLLARRR